MPTTECLRDTYFLQPEGVVDTSSLVSSEPVGGETTINLNGIYVLKPSDSELSPDIIVAKKPGFPRNFIIGTLKTARILDESFGIIHNLYSTSWYRQMNVIFGAILDPYGGEYEMWADGAPYTIDLLCRLGFDNPLKESKYYLPSNPQKITIGVFPDMKRPLFFLYDYTSLLDYGYRSFTLASYWASILVHEWEHVNQIRQGLTASSLWSERQAMTSQVKFLRQILNSRAFPTQDNEWINIQIEDLLQRIYEYRQGRGFGDHLGYIENNPLGSESNLDTDLTS